MLAKPATPHSNANVRPDRQRYEILSALARVPETFTRAHLDTARMEARQEGLNEGRTRERERIAAILALAEAEGREGPARVLALDTDMAPEAAARVLATTPKAAAPVAAGTPFPQATRAETEKMLHEALSRGIHQALGDSLQPKAGPPAAHDPQQAPGTGPGGTVQAAIAKGMDQARDDASRTPGKEAADTDGLTAFADALLREQAPD